MHTPSVLWVDLTTESKKSGLGSSPLMTAFRAVSNARELGNRSLKEGELDVEAFDAICFEYDYPDIPSLNLMQRTRSDYPEMPVLMFTEQHSEALAVWAFRTGVWDFLVKPLSEDELYAIAYSLSEAKGHRCPQKAARSGQTLVPIPDEARFRGHSADERLLQPAINFVQNHYREKISEATMAKLCGMTSYRFSRTFKKEIGVNFQDYLMRYRLGEGCRLLLNPNATIADVAFSSGFNDASYFTRVFKKYMAISPSEFRRRQVEQQENEAIPVETIFSLDGRSLGRIAV